MTDEILQEIREHRKSERLPDPSEYNEKIRQGWMPFWAPNSRRLGPYIEEAYMADDPPEAAYHIQKRLLSSGPGRH
jgi:hypothetical protein